MAEDTEMLNPDYTKGLGERIREGRRSWVDESWPIPDLFGDCDEGTALSAIRTTDVLRPCTLLDAVLVALVCQPSTRPT